MAQVKRGLGELGEISVTEKTLKSGKKSFRARAKGRRLDGKTVNVEATGPSKRAALLTLKARWDTRRGERTGSTPPAKGKVDHTKPSTGLTTASTVREVVEAWLEDDEKNLATTLQTKRQYRTAARKHVIPALGDLGLNEITSGTVTSWLRELRLGTSPSAVEASLKVLHLVKKFAAQWDILTTDFLLGVDIPPRVVKEVDATREVATAAETRAVLDLCDQHDPTLGLIITIIAQTGARPGEILALTPDQLHPGETPFVELLGTIIAHSGQGHAIRQSKSKTRKSHRYVAVGAEVMDRLLLTVAEARERWPDPEPTTGLRPVFPNRSGGWRTPENLGRALRDILRGTPYAGITPRVFRRTMATAMAAQLGDVEAAALLGHEAPAVTHRHYIRPGLSVVDGVSVYARFMAEAEGEG